MAVMKARGRRVGPAGFPRDRVCGGESSPPAGPVSYARRPLSRRPAGLPRGAKAIGPPRLTAMSSPMLVSRRHVDLVRVTSMACRMSH
ncbi:putative leader peptide [Embleya sp. NPDC001921]